MRPETRPDNVEISASLSSRTAFTVDPQLTGEQGGARAENNGTVGEGASAPLGGGQGSQWWCHIGLVTDEGFRAAVPNDLREEILRLVHGQVASGHMGRRRTSLRVRRRFIWPGMYRDVYTRILR